MGAADRQHDDDAELVQRTLAADADAFAQLYATHRERVYRLAYRFVHNQHDALDLCQEVFVRAFESLASFKGKSRFSTWLMRIASNTCIDHLRQSKVRRTG
ncbi:RNA polymerase sigma factor, partial [Planctomycetota bacterium]